MSGCCSRWRLVAHYGCVDDATSWEVTAPGKRRLTHGQRPVLIDVFVAFALNRRSAATGESTCYSCSQPQMVVRGVHDRISVELRDVAFLDVDARRSHRWGHPSCRLFLGFLLRAPEHHLAGTLMCFFHAYREGVTLFESQVVTHFLRNRDAAADPHHDIAVVERTVDGHSHPRRS